MIIFGLLDVINMSHGEFYAVGAFVGLSLAATGVNFWILIALVPILMAPLGILVERFLIRRVFDGKDRHVSTLLLTFGLFLIIEDVLKAVYGPNTTASRRAYQARSKSSGLSCPTTGCF
ncbi:MAG TPA: hypothetical protein VF503_16845 [Sphingobium sp.]|uniref:ABC transporter permease subunit n=1 Tax=Sphingobium sp. TaxID=1912891 RepID=UPI002ED07376